MPDISTFLSGTKPTMKLLPGEYKYAIEPPGTDHGVDDMASYFQKLGMTAQAAVDLAQKMVHDRVMEAGTKSAMTFPLTALAGLGQNKLASAAIQNAPPQKTPPINWGSLSSIFPEEEDPANPSNESLVKHLPKPGTMKVTKD